MAALPPLNNPPPHTDWGLVSGALLFALGVLASVMTHRLWRVIFGVGAWLVLCATGVYAASATPVSLLQRIGVAILVSSIVGSLAWHPLRSFLRQPLPTRRSPPGPIPKAAHQEPILSKNLLDEAVKEARNAGLCYALRRDTESLCSEIVTFQREAAAQTPAAIFSYLRTNLNEHDGQWR